MNITTIDEKTKLTVAVEGRMDTNTAPELAGKLKDLGEDVTELVLDFGKLVYISSAGLRVLLTLQKQMNKQGTMIVKNVNETIMEIFEITGFSDILTIE